MIELMEMEYYDKKYKEKMANKEEFEKDIEELKQSSKLGCVLLMQFITKELDEEL